MKCPNCNNENEANNKFCIHCGNPLPQEETPVQQEPVIENVEKEEVPVSPQVEEKTVVENVEETKVVNEVKETVSQPVKPQQTVAPNAASTQTAQTKQRRSLITILLAGIIVLILLVIILVTVLGGGPKKLYKNSIKNGINDLFNAEAYDAKNAKSTAIIELSSSDSNYKTLDGIKADANVQFDLEKEQALIKVKVDQNNNSYLDLNLFGDLKDKKAFLEEKNLFNKIVGVDIPDDVIEQINEVIDIENLATKDTSKERKAMSKTLIKAINDNLESSYFSKNKVTVKIDDKDKKVKDNILTLTESELKVFLTNFANTLKNDEEFLKNYEVISGERDTLVGLLEEILDSADSLADSSTSENPNQIQIHYYTSGMFNDFVGIGAIVLSEDAEDSNAIEIMKTSKDDVYTLGISEESSYGSKKETSFKMKVNKFDKNDVDVEFDLTDVGLPMTIKMKTTSEYNKGIDTFDTSKAVNINDLTQEDYEEIMENLQNSPLYSAIEMLSNYFDMDDVLDDTGDLTFDDEDDDDETSEDVKIDVEDNQSYVLSNGYNSSIDAVVFNVPSTFSEYEDSEDDYRIFKKEKGTDYVARAYIDIASSYTDPEEYLKRQVETMDYIYEDPEFYYDINISDIETVKVNGREYSKIVIEYGYGSSHTLKSKELYYVTKVGNCCYVVNISDEYDLVTDDEINEFLKISTK